MQRSPVAEKLIVEKSISKEAPFFFNERSKTASTVKNEAADASKDFRDPSNPSKIHNNLKLYAEEVNMIFSNWTSQHYVYGKLSYQNHCV